MELSDYQVLGIPEDSSVLQINDAYRALLLLVHPDKGNRLGLKYADAVKMFENIRKSYKNIMRQKKEITNQDYDITDNVLSDIQYINTQEQIRKFDSVINEINNYNKDTSLDETEEKPTVAKKLYRLRQAFNARFEELQKDQLLEHKGYAEFASDARQEEHDYIKNNSTNKRPLTRPDFEIVYDTVFEKRDQPSDELMTIDTYKGTDYTELGVLETDDYSIENSNYMGTDLRAAHRNYERLDYSANNGPYNDLEALMASRMEEDPFERNPILDAQIKREEEKRQRMETMQLEDIRKIDAHNFGIQFLENKKLDRYDKELKKLELEKLKAFRAMGLKTILQLEKEIAEEESKEA